jgi:hypothetical protein
MFLHSKIYYFLIRKPLKTGGGRARQAQGEGAGEEGRKEG